MPLRSPMALVDAVARASSLLLQWICAGWLQGQRIQPGASFDTIAGPIDNMFDFTQAPHLNANARKLHASLPRIPNVD